MAGKSRPYRVDFWKRSKGYGSVQSRKFWTLEDAKHFISGVQDDGYDTQMFGPGYETGTTWNGSSAF